MKKLLLISLLSILATACAKKEPIQKQVGMANPASVYCENIGGKSEIIKDPKGWYGLCHLPDGTTVDEWKLYRDKH
ncbi:putative hemolysin [Orbus mooreae]|uniref:putative hemolysin n=1 Tax=Orbus mooreae TaxID=3074107 RepID=UPI00370D887D